MKVLLIRPNSSVAATPVPLGLGYLAAALQSSRNDEIRILDARNQRLSVSDIKKNILDFSPNVIGITAMSFEMDSAHKLAYIAKETSPETYVVLGGPYSSSLREKVLEQCPSLDAVVIGEGEEAFVELLDVYETKRDLTKVKGIAYRKDKEIVFTGVRRPPDKIDSFSVTWDLLNPELYFKPWVRNAHNSIKKHHRILPIFTSRGCPYSCAYCHNIFGKKCRMRSTDSILNEVKYLRERYKIREVEILDDCFNYDLDRSKEILRRFADEVPELQFSLPNGIRADKVDTEFLDLLKAANFYRVTYAVETATPRIQKLIRKHLDLDKTAWAIRETARRKIVTSGFFMMGFPGETFEEMCMTAKWARESDLHIASFFYLNILPGTGLAKFVREKRAKLNWGDYSEIQVNLSDATDKQLFRANKNAYVKFYISPKRIYRILRDTPKSPRIFLNSWKAFCLMCKNKVSY